ncbi:MAG: guanylate kinase [Acidimicrobiales bacterium]
MIFVVVGPGGVGKGTVIRHLLAGDDKLWLSRSWTTRPRRPGERADAYHFVDADTFERHKAKGGFLEWATVLDHLYGTPVPQPPEGSDVVLEIDVQGARQVLARHPDAVCILLLAPSEAEQAGRLRSRGDSEEHMARRIALGKAEVAEGRQIASHEVVNDELDHAVAELAGIIDAARRSHSARP